MRVLFLPVTGSVEEQDVTLVDICNALGSNFLHLTTMNGDVNLLMAPPNIYIDVNENVKQHVYYAQASESIRGNVYLISFRFLDSVGRNELKNLHSRYTLSNWDNLLKSGATYESYFEILPIQTQNQTTQTPNQFVSRTRNIAEISVVNDPLKFMSFGPYFHDLGPVYDDEVPKRIISFDSIKLQSRIQCITVDEFNLLGCKASKMSSDERLEKNTKTCHTLLPHLSSSCHKWIALCAGVVLIIANKQQVFKYLDGLPEDMLQFVAYDSVNDE